MTIKTEYWRKPIPTDAFNWSAIDSDTYDVDFLGGENDAWRGGPIGHGATEALAIEDLLFQIAENAST